MTVQLGMGDGGDLPGTRQSGSGNVRFDRLLGKLDAAWVAFQASYDELTDDQLLVPGVTGAWSVRDLIAHVTWWDAEALKHLPLILDGGRPPRYSVTYGGIDAFNALMTERKAGLSLAEVRREAAGTHERLVAYVTDLPPEAVMANDRFKRRLRLDAYGHYPIHAGEIRAWREKTSRSSK